MIRIYPSRIPGEPLETHKHGRTTIGAWLTKNVTGYEADIEQPITVDVDGEPVHPHEWYGHEIDADSDVRIYPRPGDPVTVAVAAVVVAVATVAIALSLSVDTPSQPGQGETFDLNTAKANSVKLGHPVRQLLGQRRIYPDYIAQPISRFVGKKSMVTQMFLSVGVGEYSILGSSVAIGDTPMSVFGSDASYTLYPPGASSSSDPRTELWYVVGEVSGTKSGTAGLDTASTAPRGSSPIVDALALNNNVITLAGADAAVPGNWSPGTIINLSVPDSFTITDVGGYSRISGPLEELAPFSGQRITLRQGGVDYALQVASVTAYVAPVPGVGGSPSAVLASAAPETYNFTDDATVFTVTFQGVNRTVSLAADYINMSGLVANITSQLSGTGLVAQDNSGRLRLVEPSSPYRGGTISLSSFPVSLFGIGPTSTVGTASSGGTPEQQSYMTLQYEGGTPFAGLPNGSQRLALGYRGNRYSIANISGANIAVQRLTDTGAVDSGWPGFRSRTAIDFAMVSESSSGSNWLGPFMGCPEGELTQLVEYDIYFPSGLGYYSSSGSLRHMDQRIIVEWRDATQGGAWTRIVNEFWENMNDSIGFSRKILLPYPMRPEIRLRRGRAQEGGTVLDTIHWYGLRSRLQARPSSYPGVTTMALTVRTGDRLGAQSDRKVNLVANRVYEEGAQRSIYGAAISVLDSLGVDRSQVDMDQLQTLSSAYWTPRGETFDYDFSDSTTMRDALRMIFAAGMGHLVLSGGLISAIREGVQQPKGMLTPHDMKGDLSVGFQAPSADDFDGVDVEYGSETTWSKETVRCRLPGSQGLKIEKFKLDGVTNRTRAWVIGMRRLRKHQAQRLTFECETEMDALVYEYKDRLTLADDIPGTTQSALIVGVDYADGDQAILTVTEPLDWDVNEPRCMIRRHDGTVTGVGVPEQLGEYELAVPVELIDFDIVTDLSIEPARLLFGPSTRVGYDTMIQSITPDSDGSCNVVAIEYSDTFYADDDNQPA